MTSDELRTLRARAEALEGRLDRAEAQDVTGAVRFSAVTVDQGAYPTTAYLSMFACQRVDVFGAEDEGASATTTTLDGVFLACCLTDVLPPPGTEVLITEVETAFVMRWGK